MARILVADENREDLQFLGDALDAWGHEVLRAADGAEARALLEVGPDILITDLHLPKLDGFDVIEHARALSRPVQCIVVAEHWTPEQRARAAELGLVWLHEKPIRLERLARDIEAIGRLLAGDGLDLKM